MIDVRISEKILLTVAEAAQLSGVGQHKLRELANENNGLAVYVGKKMMLKRKKLEIYLEQAYSI